MSKPMISILNVSTGEEITREMNEDELAIRLADQKTEADRLTKETETANAKAALLIKLGITADEAALLLQ